MDVRTKTGLIVRGMWGIGDNLHQRAVLRELMKEHEIWLDSCCVSMFHDLIEQGLHILARPKGSGAAARIRDTRGKWQFEGIEKTPPPHVKERRDIGYNKEAIRRCGSILAAQFASVKLSMPTQPDFSLPVPQAWKDKAAALLTKADKPVLVYRPVILNNGWQCPSRAPDPYAYNALYRHIRDRFYVVGIANVLKNHEWIEGPVPEMDLDLTHGELDFETMAGLFSLAKMVFGNAGFTPVLAQAVGTPNVIVYGGNECFADTNSAGAHLAMTLAIEPDKPCPCHRCFHNCDKTITMEPALEKLEAFTDTVLTPTPRVLIFGTTYVDTVERSSLTTRWATLTDKVNPDCDILVVDSKSPVPFGTGVLLSSIYPTFSKRLNNACEATSSFYSFDENIGHLSRNGEQGPRSAGKDGWGRAFCFGLQAAMDQGYDFVAHIEGDSLFRLPVMPIVREMIKDNLDVVSVPVKGTRTTEVGWVETGLMIFRVGYLVENSFIGKYDWRGIGASKGKKSYKNGTPESVIFKLLGPHLKMMDWKALRGDKNQITAENIVDLDWVTHCRTSAKLDDIPLYDRFMQSVLNTKPPTPEQQDAPLRSLPDVKINLGCGENKLSGWENYDTQVNITQQLPFGDSYASHMFAEHVVEHVDYYTALRFFADCRRVLRPGGILRISVPSIENVMKRADEEYCEFARRWVKDKTGVRAGMHSILFCHGHKAAWTDSLLEASLFFAGFINVTQCKPGYSDHQALVGVEGHGKIIGDKMNWIESAVWEGTCEK